MYALYTEQREINGKNLLSWDLAHHLYLRSSHDKVIVATNRPVELLSATRRQWLKPMRQAMRQRSSTLNAVRAVELTNQISYMQNLRFSAKRPEDYLDADVTFATADDLIKTAPICRTAYVTYDIGKEKLHMLTSWMPEGGVVVTYAHLKPVVISHGKDLKDGANARTADQKSYQTAVR
ncbi:MAG TPA: hypothetical protein VFB59_02725 [Candidatus Saccharimonadales bacterium]|nr:hypothetical protein [Candidatus Saccharimonadales bacterium]